MSRNKKPFRPSEDNQFCLAKRQYEKGDFKEAYKGAKVCFRREASPEHRRLFELTSLARAQGLEGNGLIPQARDVIVELQEAGVTEVAVRNALPELLLRLGMSARGTAATAGAALEVSAETQTRVLASLADRCLIRNQAPPPNMPELATGAAAVRAALESVAQGAEAEAIERLRDIPRSSPFADWKLFVRGLAAYHRQAEDERRANWDRLDPQRPAFRLASRLTAIQSGDANLKPPEAFVRGLEGGLQKSSALAAVRELQQDLRNEKRGCLAAAKRLARLATSLDPAVYERVLEILLYQILREQNFDALTELTRVARAPAFDPRWNRCFALLHEQEQSEYEDARDLAIERWRDYLQDVFTSTVLSAEERLLAEALVWNRIGHWEEEGYHDARAEELDENEYEEGDEPEEGGDALMFRESAQEAYAEAIRCAPQWDGPVLALAMLQDAAGRNQESLATIRQFLEHVPDHLPALLAIAGKSRESAPLQSLEYALRARRLKPLDDGVRGITLASYTAVAREHIRHARWDQARTHLAEAERLDTRGESRDIILGQRATLERVAGNQAAAEELTAQLRACPGGNLAALLLLCVAGARCGLSASARQPFEKQLKAAWKGPPEAAGAARVAEILRGFLVEDVSYVGFKGHVAGALTYLRRCEKLKFTEEQMQAVCSLLVVAPSGGPTAGRFLERAVKVFPKNPHLYFMAGEQEYNKGPSRCKRRRALQMYQSFLKFADKLDAREREPMVEIARERIALLDSFGFGGMPGFDGMPGFGGFPGFEEAFGEMFSRFAESHSGAADDDDDGDDDGDDGEKAGPGRRPPSRQKRFF